MTLIADLSMDKNVVSPSPSTRIIGQSLCEVTMISFDPIWTRWSVSPPRYSRLCPSVYYLFNENEFAKIIKNITPNILTSWK